MTSYPPDYDERLLDSAPKATKAEKQEGYNVNLLASDASDSPMNARPAATVDGHTSLEAGTPPTKEAYASSYPVPWYRKKKWRIVMFITAILIIGAIVGGAVGGTLASRNNTTNSPNSGSGPVTLTLPSSTVTSTSGAPAQPTGEGAPPPGSSTPGIVTSSGPGAVPTGAGVPPSDPDPTPPSDSNNVNGIADSGPMVAPVVAW